MGVRNGNQEELSAISIIPAHPVRRLSQDEFGELSYAVMAHVFEIHNEFGRFFDERIYKRELASPVSRCRIGVSDHAVAPDVQDDVLS